MIKAGIVKNKRGETFEIKYDIDSDHFKGPDGSYYTENGICMFWSTCNERFFMNTDHRSDLVMDEPEIDRKTSYRNDIIDECIKALGGRYGASATKDLQSLKTRK